MLLRLSVSNFKSIRTAGVRFGPLTCLLGHNGVGKSNLFDAVQFLSLLADRDIFRAASDVRRSSEGSSSPLDLVRGRDPEALVELSADMVVPDTVQDDFGRVEKSSATLLTYRLVLRYDKPTDRLLVQAEELHPVALGRFDQFLGFEAKRDFRGSIAKRSRRGGALISTDADQGVIALHGDGGSRGRPAPVGTSPLTVVGGTSTVDYPTVLAAKREMLSWRALQLEPSAMRAPDRRGSDPHITDAGGHLAATLAQLQQRDPHARLEVVNRLRELNSDIEDLDVLRDEARDQLVLRARVVGVQEWLWGRSLSDGTLRYIALALMLADTQERGVLCLEEPENGIHPSRVPDLVKLLYDYAVDPEEKVGEDNPLRQVIINTHSPEVARQLDSADVVFVERARTADGGAVSAFRPIDGSWRAVADRGEGNETVPQSPQALADFIGGSPVRGLSAQLQLESGTAT